VKGSKKVFLQGRVNMYLIYVTLFQTHLSKYLNIRKKTLLMFPYTQLLDFAAS